MNRAFGPLGIFSGCSSPGRGLGGYRRGPLAVAVVGCCSGFREHQEEAGADEGEAEEVTGGEGFFEREEADGACDEESAETNEG